MSAIFQVTWTKSNGEETIMYNFPSLREAVQTAIQLTTSDDIAKPRVKVQK